jgi:hypothetical protein
MMKRCPKCCKVLPSSDFHRRRGALSSYCKNCGRLYRKAHYHKNLEKYGTKRRINNQRYRHRNREMVIEYLLDHPCVDCGISDPLVLEFDHMDNKIMDVSSLAGSSVAWKRVEAEIAKCVVRCANCHRKRTALDRGWYKWIVDGM